LKIAGNNHRNEKTKQYQNNAAASQSVDSGDILREFLFFTYAFSSNHLNDPCRLSLSKGVATLSHPTDEMQGHPIQGLFNVTRYHINMKGLVLPDRGLIIL
jgi:hypothetical protein